MTGMPCPRPDKAAHATKAAAAAQRLAMGRPVDSNVYHCQCGSWHVGHIPVKVRRRARRQRAAASR